MKNALAYGILALAIVVTLGWAIGKVEGLREEVAGQTIARQG